MKGAEQNQILLQFPVPSDHRCPYLGALASFVLFLNIMGKQKKGKAKEDGEEKQTKVFYCGALFSYASNELWAFE